MIKVYAELGYGNGTFFSTEFEDGSIEYRIPKFLKPNKIKEFYVRLWIFKKVIIFSTLYGLKLKSKNNSKFKVLLGVGGISKNVSRETF